MAEKKQTKAKKTKSWIGIQFIFSMFFLLIASVLFFPTVLILVVGMIPTLVAVVIDNTAHKSRPVTVGVLNFSGCFPFLMDVWMAPDQMEQSLQLVSNPMTIIMMYVMAGAGYVLNWITGIVTTAMMVGQNERRIQKIETLLQALEKRWGQKVNGSQPLDDHGFPAGNQKPEPLDAP